MKISRAVWLSIGLAVFAGSALPANSETLKDYLGDGWEIKGYSSAPLQYVTINTILMQKKIV
jgi:hypothetical protein